MNINEQNDYEDDEGAWRRLTIVVCIMRGDLFARWDGTLGLESHDLILTLKFAVGITVVLRRKAKKVGIRERLLMPMAPKRGEGK